MIFDSPSSLRLPCVNYLVALPRHKHSSRYRVSVFTVSSWSHFRDQAGTGYATTLLRNMLPFAEILQPVAHRQWAFTIPKQLRAYFRFTRGLLGQLCRAACETVHEAMRLDSYGEPCTPAICSRQLSREGKAPGREPPRPCARANRFAPNEAILDMYAHCLRYEHARNRRYA